MWRKHILVFMCWPCFFYPGVWSRVWVLSLELKTPVWDPEALCLFQSSITPRAYWDTYGSPVKSFCTSVHIGYGPWELVCNTWPIASLSFSAQVSLWRIPPVNWPFSLKVQRWFFIMGLMDYLEQNYPGNLLKMHIPGSTPHMIQDLWE